MDLEKTLENHKKWMQNKAGGIRANLEGADLRGANLRGADLECANLRGADLECANLEWANLRAANLEGADLGGADLEWANLEEANLEGADLEWAHLGAANLRGANLRGADLEGANLGFNCNLSSAKTDFKFFQMAGIGTEKRSILYIVDIDKIFCGCFSGTLEEFEKEVEKTHCNSKQFLEEYRLLIYYFKMQKITWEQ